MGHKHNLLVVPILLAGSRSFSIHIEDAQRMENMHYGVLRKDGTAGGSMKRDPLEKKLAKLRLVTFFHVQQ